MIIALHHTLEPSRSPFRTQNPWTSFDAFIALLTGRQKEPQRRERLTMSRFPLKKDREKDCSALLANFEHSCGGVTWLLTDGPISTLLRCVNLWEIVLRRNKKTRDFTHFLTQKSTQWCRFHSQSVHENSRFLCCSAAWVSPLRPLDFRAGTSNFYS